MTQLEPAGVGEWFRLFEERKAQFEEMGMFSEEYKKPIPRFAKSKVLSLQRQELPFRIL